MEDDWSPTAYFTACTGRSILVSAPIQEASAAGRDGCANLSLVCCYPARLTSELDTPHSLFPQHENKSEALLHRC